MNIAAPQNMLLVDKRLASDKSEHLDAWRGVSALAVFVSHTVQIFGQTASWIKAIATGSVMVFFVLSGFFIQKSAARSFSIGRPGSFVVNRANRLLPPFTFAMVMVLALWAAAPLFFPSGSRVYIDGVSRSSFSIDGWPETALLLNAFVGRTISANAPLWSLSYEVGYYVLAWLLMCLVTGRKIGLLLIPCASILIIKYHDLVMLGSVWFAGFLIGILHSNSRIFKPSALFSFP